MALPRPVLGGKLIRSIPVSKKTVVEIVCDRCDRTEYLPPEENYVLPDLSVQFGVRNTPDEKRGAPNTGPEDYETEVKFDELCSSCKKTIRNLVGQITKKINWRRGSSEEPEGPT